MLNATHVNRSKQRTQRCIRRQMIKSKFIINVFAVRLMMQTLVQTGPPIKEDLGYIKNYWYYTMVILVRWPHTKDCTGFLFPETTSIVWMFFLEALGLPFQRFSYDGLPRDALLSRAHVDLIHLRQADGACTNEENSLLLHGHFSDYQSFKGDDWRFVILHEAQS